MAGAVLPAVKLAHSAGLTITGMAGELPYAWSYRNGFATPNLNLNLNLNPALNLPPPPPAAAAFLGCAGLDLRASA